MLVLTRKPGEKILIGEDIVLTVVEARGDGVRIGIEAPRSVRIRRSEIIEAVEHANVEAAKAGTTDPSAMARLLRGAVRPVD